MKPFATLIVGIVMFTIGLIAITFLLAVFWVFSFLLIALFG